MAELIVPKLLYLRAHKGSIVAVNKDKKLATVPQTVYVKDGEVRMEVAAAHPKGKTDKENPPKPVPQKGVAAGGQDGREPLRSHVANILLQDQSKQQLKAATRAPPPTRAQAPATVTRAQAAGDETADTQSLIQALLQHSNTKVIMGFLYK